MLPDVLCPWSYTEFCLRAADCEFGLLAQQHLRKIMLNFPDKSWHEKMYLVDTSRMDYIRPSNSSSVKENYDKILLNDRWLVRPQVEIVKDKGLCAKICRHHRSYSSRKRL